MVSVEGWRNDLTVDTGQGAVANTEERAATTSDDVRREKVLTLEELGGLRRLEEALEGQKDSLGWSDDLHGEGASFHGTRNTHGGGPRRG